MMRQYFIKHTDGVVLESLAATVVRIHSSLPFSMTLPEADCPRTHVFPSFSLSLFSFLLTFLCLLCLFITSKRFGAKDILFF